MKKSRFGHGLLGLWVVVLMTPYKPWVTAATLDGNTDLTSDSVQIPLESGTQNVTYKASAVFGSATGGAMYSVTGLATTAMSPLRRPD